MIRPKDKHARYIEVCADNACRQCDSTEPYVPGDCPFAILHLLSTGDSLNDGKLIRKPRRSGKTTRILKHARMRAQMGEAVVIMVANSSERRRMEQVLRDEAGDENKNIKIMCAESLKQGQRLIGNPNLSLLADEINSADLETILMNTSPGVFKGGLTTRHD